MTGGCKGWRNVGIRDILFHHPFYMSTNPLPTSLYESLLVKLVTIIQLTQSSEGTATPQSKQALLQATNDYKSAVIRAKELAASLPGGELLVEDQDEVITMLEKLRDRKREQLSKFAARVIVSGGPSALENKMEIDSMASTPFHE
ncbi:hypothetical protein BDZ94DRAFT_1250212 [Collybia nuda]|uniref:Mediator of RNA polymerase II transcription subunit 9 n=1 Tax=Collybia nuda TaxID=64659 RepID=A0A9P6CNT2_9AGAR|nr:hypothetical protein BDZ94DRAFT_1250212 [Collybia nuda]